MAYECRIERDSINHYGNRLTTFVVTFPRIVLAEFNTHRILSKNSASSRAIPIEKQVEKVKRDLFYPVHWGKNQKGMQAEEELVGDELRFAKNRWEVASEKSLESVQELLEIGVHKQITNRLLEPFMWHTAVVTGTEFSNFFNLRDHGAAQPEIRVIAHMMRECYEKHDPTSCLDTWHLPFVDFDTEIEIGRDANNSFEEVEKLARTSAARCARVSYLTHDGKRDYKADLAMYDRLVGPGHMSPLEHPARPMTEDEREMFKQQRHEWCPVAQKMVPVLNNDGTPQYTHFLGNVQGWVQLRKTIPNEYDVLGNR